MELNVIKNGGKGDWASRMDFRKLGFTQV